MQTAYLKNQGTIQRYAHQSEVERMSTKAQEVAIDRLLVDRFKQGDPSAFDEMVSKLAVASGGNHEIPYQDIDGAGAADGLHAGAE